MATNGEHETVTLDEQGRITVSEHVRNRLRLRAGDDLVLVFDGDEIRL